MAKKKAFETDPIACTTYPCASTKPDERTSSSDSSWYLSLTRLFWPVLIILSIVPVQAPWAAKSPTQSNKCANTAHNGSVQNAGGCTLTLQSRKQFQKHRLYIGLRLLLGITNLHVGPASAQVLWRILCLKLIRMLIVCPKKHNLWTLYRMGETSEVSQTDNTVHDLIWTCVSNLIRCCSKLTASWPSSYWTVQIPPLLMGYILSC